MIREILEWSVQLTNAKSAFGFFGFKNTILDSLKETHPKNSVLRLLINTQL